MLLAWAVDFVRLHTDELERSYIDGNGDIVEPGIAGEIAEARQWLKDVEAFIKEEK